MGRRRREADDLTTAATGVGVRDRTVASGRSVHDHVLTLQRDYGNAAVTGVVVQRRPHAASTDAPGAKKKAVVKAPAEPVVEDLRPKKANPEYKDWDDDRIRGWLGDHEADAKGRDLLGMGAMREELYFRHPDLSMALNLYRVFKRIGDQKKADFWLAFGNSKGHLLDPKPEDMTGKEF